MSFKEKKKVSFKEKKVSFKEKKKLESFLK